MERLKNRYTTGVLLCIATICLFIVFYAYHRLKFRFAIYRASSYVNSPCSYDGDKNTYTWLIHMYPPSHNAGAEMMAHAMNRFLIREKNAKVNVILNNTPVANYEQVRIYQRNEKDVVASVICKSQLLISHLDYEPNAVKTAALCKRPLVLVMHNSFRKKFLREFIHMLPNNLYLVHNSKWIQDYYKEFNLPSIVVYPPVDWRDYVIESTKEYVSLINMNENKGGLIFMELVKRMPDVKFLGVKGAYDKQVLLQTDNLTLIDNTPNIKEIYGKTKILLMPSKYESWGRTAVEAMSSGIPVIAHPTPGLKESCGDAGIYCDRENLEAWVKEIRKLMDDDVYYNTKSSACKRRAIALDPEPQLDAFAKWLEGIAWKDSNQPTRETSEVS